MSDRSPTESHASPRVSSDGLAGITIPLLTPYPYSLINLLIAMTLFAMYTAIAITNNGLNAYVIFLIFLTLYILILSILFINYHFSAFTLLLSLILFIGFYNYLPLIIIKNASPNNYISLVTAFLIVGSLFSYYYGSIKFLSTPANPKAGVTQSMNNVIMTLLLSFVGAFTMDSIVFGCLGTSYFPNYVINSNIDVCSRPSKQSFKCSMYKDGKIIS